MADSRGYVPLYTHISTLNPLGGTSEATMNIFKYNDGAVYWELRRFYYPIKAMPQSDDTSEDVARSSIKGCTDLDKDLRPNTNVFVSDMIDLGAPAESMMPSATAAEADRDANG